MRAAGGRIRLGLCLALLGCLWLAACLETDIRGYVMDLRSPNVLVRQEAVSALALAADPMAVPHLVVLLDDPAAEVRRLTAKTLGALHDQRATDALTGRLAREAEDRVRLALIEALGKLRDTKAVPDLLRLLGEEGRPLLEQYTLIWALGSIGDPRAGESLSRLLDSPDKYAAYNATQALKRLRY